MKNTPVFALLLAGALCCRMARADVVAKPRTGTEQLNVKLPHVGVPAGFTIRHSKDGTEMVWLAHSFSNCENQHP